MPILQYIKSISLTKKAIKYKRYSSDEQSKFSFERQDIIIDQWAANSKVEFVDSFEDKGISGRSFERSEVKALFDFIKKSHRSVDYLVVSELTRFSRDAGSAIEMVKSIQNAYGIRIVSASRGSIYDCNDNNSFFMMGLEFLLGNSENIKRQNDINGGIYAAKTKKGRWIQGGPAPYGYYKLGEKENRRLEINEEEAAVIRFIYKQHLSGVPNYLILQQAKDLGFNVKGTNPIGEILKKPLYMSYQQVNPWKDQPGGLFPIKNLTPIIEPEIWHEVQRRNAKPIKHRTLIDDDYPLRGVLKCQCGKPVTGAASTGRSGMKYNYYKCRTSGHMNLSTKTAHDKLLQALDYLSIPQRLLTNIRSETQRMIDEKLKDKRQNAARAKREMDAINKKIQSLEEKFISNEISFETYNRWFIEYTRKRDELSITFDNSNIEPSTIQDLLDRNLDKLANLKYLYIKATTVGKQQLINHVFDHTLTYKNGTYRTTFLPYFFRNNLLIMKHKHILVYDNNIADPFHVEATGVEPVSKHILQKLSTCLFLCLLSAMNRERTNLFKA